MPERCPNRGCDHPALTHVPHIEDGSRRCSSPGCTCGHPVIDVATFAIEHGCSDLCAEVVLGSLGPTLGAELLVRMRGADYDQRVHVATELLNRRNQASR